MKKLNILAVVGDIGGATELLPALDLIGRDHQVTVMLDPAGAAKGILEKQGVPWVAFDPRSNELPFCDVVAVGTSAKQHGAQIALTRAARHTQVPVVWVEDLYGCGSRAAVREARDGCMPDVLCVMDDVAAQIARACWPDTDVLVCGKPSWAPLAEQISHRAEIRTAVRAELGVGKHEQLVTSWHGGENAAHERMTLDALYDNSSLVTLRVAVRLHPGMVDKDALSKFQALVKSWEGLTLSAAAGIPAEQLTIASDAVVATWGSTQGYVSVLAGIPTVVTAYGDAHEQMRALQYPDAKPPHVYARAARIAVTQEMLSGTLLAVLGDLPGNAAVTVDRAAPMRAALEPGAAQRIADAILDAAR